LSIIIAKLDSCVFFFFFFCFFFFFFFFFLFSMTTANMKLGTILAAMAAGATTAAAAAAAAAAVTAATATPSLVSARAVLEKSISDRVFPGATFAIISPHFGDSGASASAVLLGAAGSQCYAGDNTAAPYNPGTCAATSATETMYDLASLTKVSVTTTLAILLSS
jgi:hypothetical protein